MRDKKTIARILFLIVLSCLVFTGNAHSITDDHFFAFGMVNWHSRDGMIDFGGDHVQHFERKLLRTQGIAVGKNFSLPLSLRIAVPLLLEFGKVQEGTVEDMPLDDGLTHDLIFNSVLYHAGLQPMIQFPLRLSDGVWTYAAIGGGLHYVTLLEEERIASDRRRVSDNYLERSSRISTSAAVSAGMEFEVSSRLVFSFKYLFRFWKPVARKTARDLFPYEKLPYTERFFTHGISAGFLFSRIH
jgi:hypothetical protein